MKEIKAATYSASMGFCSLLTIAFIVLKLTNVIDWSWWWILAPIWIPIAVVMALLAIDLIISLIKEER